MLLGKGGADVRVAIIGIAVVALLVPEISAAAASPFHPGSPSNHDRIVPGYGNGGYDVAHYGIHVRYNPDNGRLRGRTRVSAVATSNLSRFHLDFALPVTKVTVNGQRATAHTRRTRPAQYGKELVVTPRHGLPEGERFIVVVRYDAHPFDVKVLGYSSWVHTPTGMTDWNEPQSGPQWWYPSK